LEDLDDHPLPDEEDDDELEGSLLTASAFFGLPP
jgi:hypothetical protein